MRDLIDRERQEILAMLCEPEAVLAQWKAAPGTCALYKSMSQT